MVRPLRINVEDGWYHICSRGVDRRTIYSDDRERVHFLELLEGAVEKYRLVIHAYALMSNHYHLVVQTPDANLSAAMQWLTTSYSMWFNKRHNRVGPLFQGRYKSIPIENSIWGYDCSLYVHLNPVVRSEFGLDPWSKKVESFGLVTPRKEEVKRRLKEIRSYLWSSYRAYAGYCKAPGWLTTKEILQRACKRAVDRQTKYRKDAEYKLVKGVSESFIEKLKDGVALGTAGYLKKIKGLAKECSRDIEGRKKLRERVSYEDVLKVVENICGEKYAEFMNRRGDYAKPLVMWAARRYCCMTLREIGDRLGGMDYGAVSMAIRRFERQAVRNRKIKGIMKQTKELMLTV